LKSRHTVIKEYEIRIIASSRWFSAAAVSLRLRRPEFSKYNFNHNNAPCGI